MLQIFYDLYSPVQTRSQLFFFSSTGAVRHAINNNTIQLYTNIQSKGPGAIPEYSFFTWTDVILNTTQRNLWKFYSIFCSLLNKEMSLRSPMGTMFFLEREPRMQTIDVLNILNINFLLIHVVVSQKKLIMFFRNDFSQTCVESIRFSSHAAIGRKDKGCESAMLLFNL